jgi:hypothetical membrane protein
MTFDNSKVAGTLLLVGGAQFVIALIIAEAIYPNYSISANYISDLGVWSKPSAAIFNPSIILFGSATLASSIFIKKQFKLGKIAYLFALAGAGTIGVGIFPEDTFLVNGIPVIHAIAALLAFVVGGISAVAAYKYTKSPFKIISVILGAATLIAAVLFFTTRDFGYLGLGVGGMERMMSYPTLLWIIGFGGYLLGTSNDKSGII